LETTDITADDLVAALEEAQAADSPNGLLTTAELAERLGRNDKWVRLELAKLKRAGRLECVRVYRESIAGYAVTVPGYRLVNGKES
jgi:hypothetical protein